MKRYEFLVQREKANEIRAKHEAEELHAIVAREHSRGVLTPEDYCSLLDEWHEAVEREWEATERVCRATVNLRLSHVAYCRARMSAPLNAPVITYRESLARVEELPQVVPEIHSPVLTLLANSLPTHAPPLELASITETLAS
jgi:hypothetical protein